MLTQYFPVASIFLQSVFYSEQNESLLCVCITLSVFIHLLMDIYVGSTSSLCESSPNKQGCTGISVGGCGVLSEYEQAWDIWVIWQVICYCLRNLLCIDFHSDCSSLHSHQQWINLSLSLHPLQDLLSFIFFIFSILTFICFSLMLANIRHH